MGRLRTRPLCLIAVLAALAWALPCQALTVAQEEELARKFMQQVREHLIVLDDPVVSPYVESVGRFLLSKLGPQPFEYDFYVVEQNVYNAFAGPAGNVFINTGLLGAMENEEELASILAHEIAHVYFRHISDKVSRAKKIQLASLAGMLAGIFLGGGALTSAAVVGSTAAGHSAMLAYSREDEAQADAGGMAILQSAGYGCQGMLDMFSKIRRKRWFGPEEIPTYLTTHPALEERLAALDTHLAAHPEKLGGTRKVDSYAFEKVRARVLALYEDPGVAGIQIDHLLKENPDNPAALYGKALLLDRKGHRKDALAELEKALEYKPFDPDQLRLLGQLSFEEGDNQRALQALTASVGARPGLGAGWFWLGRVRLAMGETGQAARDLEKAHFLNPDQATFLHYLAQARGKLKEMGHAHYYLGLHHILLRDYKDAKFHLKKARENAGEDLELREKIKKVLDDNPLFGGPRKPAREKTRNRS